MSEDLLIANTAKTDIGFAADHRSLQKLKKLGQGDKKDQALALKAAAEQFEALLNKYWLDAMKQTNETINPDSPLHSKYSSFFDDVEMESCKFVWKGTIVFMGGVLEAQVCGRADLTDEYYEKITEEYEWKKARNLDKDYSDYKDVEILTDFLQNNEYYISDEYVGNFPIWAYLSKAEKAIYFYGRID